MSGALTEYPGSTSTGKMSEDAYAISRRPRHSLKGRQIAGEIARVGLRLQLRKAQAEAGDIVLLYGDESEALTHPYLARAWAKRGADLRVPAPGQAKKVAMIGSLDHLTRQLIVHTSPTKRSSDFIAHLEQLDRLYSPQPGRAMKPVVLVEDNGPIHVSKLALAALEARKHWLTVEWLPKYAPELNDIEVVWHDLKAHNLAHYTFTDAADLDRAIHQAVQALNNERSRNPLVNWRILLVLTAERTLDVCVRAASLRVHGVRASRGKPPSERRGFGVGGIVGSLPGYQRRPTCSARS